MPDENKKSSAGYDSKIEVAWEMTRTIYTLLHPQGVSKQKARTEFQEIFTECLQTIIRAENDASGREDDAENDGLISKRK